MVIQETYLSDNMKQMRELLKQYLLIGGFQQQQIINQFGQLCNGLYDKDEVLMSLYLCVSRFGLQQHFQSILVRNHSFKDIQPAWNILLTEKNIFSKLVKVKTSMERSQFNFIVLK